MLQNILASDARPQMIRRSPFVESRHTDSCWLIDQDYHLQHDPILALRFQWPSFALMLSRPPLTVLQQECEIVVHMACTQRRSTVVTLLLDQRFLNSLALSGCIELRIQFSWHWCAHLLAPCFEDSIQFVSFLRQRFGKVVSFADILPEIE